MWEVAAAVAAGLVSAHMAEKQARATPSPPSIGYYGPAPTKEITSAKCPCCGSRQFVSQQSRRICSYCRSEQDGQPVQVVRAAQTPLAGGWGDLYGGAVLRPEMAVRIAKL